jgi:8-oxo-dGTP diphosphatase
MDWTSWQPREKCVLCFIVRQGQILLIRKKRGLGAGKINGPGGRLEPGENIELATIRECEEELHITPRNLRLAGELWFQFADGHSIHVSVHAATDFSGQPTETDEAVPLWFPLEDIPFDEMWADDREWFPHFFAEQYFLGKFTFAGDQMTGKEMTFPEKPSSLVLLKQSITAAIC